MNIYLVCQTDNRDYDTYDSFVCIASSIDEAKAMFPDSTWRKENDNPIHEWQHKIDLDSEKELFNHYPSYQEAQIDSDGIRLIGKTGCSPINLDGSENLDDRGYSRCPGWDWALKKENIHAILVGKAAEEMKKGIICASFNAG